MARSNNGSKESKPKMVPIPGYPGYFATKEGRIFSTRPCRGTTFRELRPYIRRWGHRSIGLMLNGKTVRKFVHYFVAITFIGPRPSDKHEMRHLDGDAGDNTVGNLSWGTSKENHQDMIRHGRSVRGERNAGAKLTTANVLEIRRLLAAGQTEVAIGKKFGVTRGAIKCIKLGKNWKHVPVEANA